MAGTSEGAVESEGTKTKLPSAGTDVSPSREAAAAAFARFFSSRSRRFRWASSERALPELSLAVLASRAAIWEILEDSAWEAQEESWEGVGGRWA